MGNPASGQFKPGQKDPETVARWAEALRYRSSGMSYDQVAKSLGYADAASAYNAVQSALDATLTEAADEYRKLELERLDRVQSALWVTATKIRKARDDEGHPAEPSKRQLEVIDRLMKVMERRARLLGLDAATKIEADHTSGGQPFAGVAPILPAMTRAASLAGANGNGNGHGHGDD